MKQLPSEHPVTISRGVNPGTAVGILAGVAFVATVTFVGIAHSFYADPHSPGSNPTGDTSSATPSTLRPGEGDELATTRTETEVVSPSVEETPAPAPEAAPEPRPHGRRGSRGRAERSHIDPRPRPEAATPTVPTAPRPGRDDFGRNVEDPLGNLTFDSTISG